MSDTTCTYRGDREQAIVEFLYGELTPEARAAFETHLDACGLCRDEIAAFQGVQERLEAWLPPAPSVLTRDDTRRSASGDPGARMGRVVEIGQGHARRALSRASLVDDAKEPRQIAWRRWREVPLWARTAAALLLVGAGLGVANLDVRYGPEGLSVRTGWLPSPAPAAPAAASSDWRADLAATESRLRAELRHVAEGQLAASAPATARTVPAKGDAVPMGERVASDPGASDKDVMVRMRALVADSERRQQRELALRIAEVFRDVQAQRQSDLVRIDRSLGLMQNSTGIEVARQRELLNSLAVRVSQRQ